MAFSIQLYQQIHFFFHDCLKYFMLDFMNRGQVPVDYFYMSLSKNATISAELKWLFWNGEVILCHHIKQTLIKSPKHLSYFLSVISQELEVKPLYSSGPLKVNQIRKYSNSVLILFNFYFLNLKIMPSIKSVFNKYL